MKNPAKKRKIAAALLVVLGIAIGVIGAAGAMAPPIITAIGFFVIAWALAGSAVP